MASLRYLICFLVGLVAFAAPASATWSIVIVNLATGEVAVGIATCLTGFDLRPNTVVVVPGYGVAAAQSYVGPLSLRQLIRDGFLNGETSNQILASLAAADPGHQSRQYGIVSLIGGEETFTGSGAGAWAGGVVGQSGNFRYAIQGNVLTGQPVITAAEQAILTTPGGLPDKLMAAMEAARSMGGDGRCSCSSSNPTSCGAPPPNFTKSSHIGLMIVSRPSDQDTPCGGSLGCGAGDYWMDLNVANQSAGAVDPVIQLQGLFNSWKANQVGRPDHYESTVTTSASTIRANGMDTVSATVELKDAQGNPIGNSLPLTVQLAANSTASNVTIGPVTAQPNGTYSFTLSGDLSPGVAVLDVVATDSFGTVGIWPRPMITLTDLFGSCGDGAIPDGQGGELEALKINGTTGVGRVVEVGYGQPFTLTLDPPVGVPGTFPVGMFALWAQNGVPVPGSELQIGGNGGSLCFTPSLLMPSAPNVLLADSFGLGGVISAQPAPWSFTVPGLPMIVDASLQGAMLIDTQPALAATNAVYLRIRALPSPTISAISPLSPTPGQLVTVTGGNFFTGMAGRIGSTPLTLNLVSATEVQFSMPAGVVCDSILELGNPGGGSVSDSINPSPLIIRVAIPTGPAAGGSTFVVLGLGLLGATVTVGGAPIQVISQSNSSVYGLTPPGPVGPATVLVQNPNGCQDTGIFTYL